MRGHRVLRLLSAWAPTVQHNLEGAGRVAITTLGNLRC